MSESADSLPSYQILNQAVAEHQHFVPFQTDIFKMNLRPLLKTNKLLCFWKIQKCMQAQKINDSSKAMSVPAAVNIPKSLIISR